jgi:hypothetical protein
MELESERFCKEGEIIRQSSEDQRVQQREKIPYSYIFCFVSLAHPQPTPHEDFDENAFVLRQTICPT